MKILDNLLVSLDNPEVVNPIKMDRAYRLYKYEPDKEKLADPEYGNVVFVARYKWIQPMQDFAPYKHPFVIAWTVPGSDVSHISPDHYAKSTQHEAIHHLEWILSIDNHTMEEHATRQTDWHWQQMGYDVQSVPYLEVRRVHDTSHYIA